MDIESTRCSFYAPNKNTPTTSQVIVENEKKKTSVRYKTQWIIYHISLVHFLHTFVTPQYKKQYTNRETKHLNSQNSSTVWLNPTKAWTLLVKWRPTFFSVHFYKNFNRAANHTRCFVLFTALIIWTNKF